MPSAVATSRKRARAGGEEAAEQAAGLEFFEAGLPAIGAAADSFEDSRKLG